MAVTIAGWFLTERVFTPIVFADEGLLWYNTLQLKEGRIPIVDFNAYDPFRYYWSLGWMKIFGQGLTGLRLSLAILRFAGLTFALYAARCVTNSASYLSLFGIANLFWLVPRHKLPDIIVPAVAVLVLFYYLQKPSLHRHFLLGIALGFCAFVGRNHGLYLALSFSFAILLVHALGLGSDSLPGRLLYFMGGVGLGYLPMLIMFIFVPGFLAAFIDNVMFLEKLGTTNLAIPIPWPWRVDFSQGYSILLIQNLIISSLFLFVPLVYVAESVYMGRKMVRQKKLGSNLLPEDYMLLSSILVGVPYLNHIFSRADLSHLSQGSLPFWLSLLAVFALWRHRWTWAPRVFLAIFLLCTFFVQVCPTIFWDYWNHPASGTTVKVRSEAFWATKQTADLLIALEQTIAKNSQTDEKLFLAPDLPGLYSLLGIQAPTRNAYFVFYAQNGQQEEVIQDLERERVNFALIHNNALDGIKQRKFSNMYPILWSYLSAKFVVVDVQELPPTYVVFRRK